MKRLGIALIVLCSLLAASPAWADSFAEGQAALKRGDYSEAIRLFTLDIQSGQNTPENLAVVYNQRGLAYRRSGQPDKAIADYNRAMKLAPGDADLYNNRGIAYKAKGDLRRALADYNQAIELNPRQANAYYNRSIVHQKRGNLARAIADVKRFIELKPDDPDGPARLKRLEKLR